MNLMAAWSRGAKADALPFAEAPCRSPKNASSVTCPRPACAASHPEYPMSRRSPRIILSLALLLGASVSHAAIEFTPYELVAYDGAKAQVERGEIAVPENRARPDGRQIKLGFVRFPA